jgi:alpha-1,2-mannosyltransferase
MAAVVEILRSGAWLTTERIRLVAAAIITVSVVSLAYLAVTANGLVDSQGRPLGTDFSSFYAAGTYVLEGRPAAPYEPALQHAREQAMFGPAAPFYSWFYPPIFLFAAAILASMPYGVALAVWLGATLGLYVAAIRAIVPTPLRAATRDWLLLALAFPAVLVNLGHGQNGFLSAALFGGALALLDRRPAVAGILFGLLAYKPQFALMIPFALAASGRWRALVAAGAAALALAIATTVAFGADVWGAFVSASHFARIAVLEQGDVGFYKMQSLFAWARLWGAPVSLAYALQGTLTALLAVTVAALWRGATPYALKAAALCLAAILATPFAFDYDMMVLAPAIAFLVIDGLERGFTPWEKTGLAVVWLMPIVARTLTQTTMIPLGVPVMLAAFILLLRRSTFSFASPIAFSSKFLLK